MSFERIKRKSRQLFGFPRDAWIDNHTNTNIVKLCLLAIAGAVITVAILQAINLLLFRIRLSAVCGCAAFPLLVLVVEALNRGGMGRFSQVLMEVKYNHFYPIHFYFIEEADQAQLLKIGAVKKLIHTGDILLRRHKNDLAGTILGQTSYYTHAGLCIREQDGLVRVMHSVGGTGVSYEAVRHFCHCEEFVLLRFHANPALFDQQLQKLGNSLGFIDGPEKAVARKTIYVPAINGNRRARAGDLTTFSLGLQHDGTAASEDEANLEIMVTRLEDSLYHELFHRKLTASEVPPDYFTSLLYKKAKFLQGRPFDYNFNFTDDSKLSCIEFVWYCYKALAPLHQIKRKPFTYMGCIKAYVILPDMFLENCFFDVIYASTGKSKTETVEYAKTHHFNFSGFCMKIVLAEIILFLTFTLVRFLSGTDLQTASFVSVILLLTAAYCLTVLVRKTYSLLGKLN